MVELVMACCMECRAEFIVGLALWYGQQVVQTGCWECLSYEEIE